MSVGRPPMNMNRWPDSLLSKVDTMQIICRLIGLSAAAADGILADPAGLPQRAAAASSSSDVYRYWHAIEFLLHREVPTDSAAEWLSLGRPVPGPDPTLPAHRVLAAAEVVALDAVVREVPPEALAAHYDAPTMDAASIYPGTWQAWEEDFDPLGQVLEHYSFLQEFVSRCAARGSAMLLQFDLLAEGSV